LPPHFYPFSHPTLHHPTRYYFKFILKNQPPLLLFSFIPAVIDQVPKPFIPLILFLLYLLFLPLVWQGLAVGWASHSWESCIALEIWCYISREVKWGVILLLLYLLGHKIFIQLDTYCLTYYLSQMATYWFVIGWFDNQSVQKSKVRQAAKDVVKSEVYP